MLGANSRALKFVGAISTQRRGDYAKIRRGERKKVNECYSSYQYGVWSSAFHRATLRVSALRLNCDRKTTAYKSFAEPDGHRGDLRYQRDRVPGYYLVGPVARLRSESNGCGPRPRAVRPHCSPLLLADQAPKILRRDAA